ncbi:hypothetical protein Clacol_002963 [Clathrus columnatus]|uniref:Cytochrome P450 n=1 Tax=Clathrus columnatus TaxID=1419009 RepID=A0AAV5A278_9AGAM|nr:hypothetical protein Clacol_002963 [Clathrus columnatus]
MDIMQRRSLTIPGDIIHIPTFKNHIIVLNSSQPVFDLLERRGNIYSNRMHGVMLHELIRLEPSTVFAEYGQEWRNHRKIYSQQMNINTVKKFQSYQVAAARDLLSVLLTSPEHFMKHCRHFAAGIVMNIAYGHQVARENDEFVMLAETNGRQLSQAFQPGTRYTLPESEGADIGLTRVNQRDGTVKSCFVSNSLEEIGTDAETNEDVKTVKAIAGGIFGAGAITTSSSLNSFILAMVLYPEVQKKAQEELDGVVGASRLPLFEDRPKLPYINAIVKEVLRWFPVIPTGIPHVTTEEDVYAGYRIPKGSIIIPNTWNLLHDPATYPDPSVFRPERFLPDKNGGVARDPAVNGAFGYGRRICPGRNLAEATTWIAAASILSTFNIQHAMDENGRDIDVSHALESVPGIFKYSQIYLAGAGAYQSQFFSLQ